jgi:dihydroxyacetone kinase
MLVRPVVINDEMHIEPRRDAGIDLLQEPEKLLVPMARLALGNDLAVGDVECREQGRRAVAFIIMREAISIAEAHRQHRLSSLQRLDLALLIDTKNHGVFGRAEI